MRKKLTAILLAAAMTASLTACGSNGTGGESTQASASSEGASVESTAAEGTQEASGEVNLYGFDEPVTIKVGISYAAASDFTFYGGETVEDNAWMDLYNANNIYLDILYNVDPSQAETKLSTAIMSGDYPDIIQTTAADYKNYVESGVIADVTDVYEQYASEELKEYMNYDGGMAMGALEVEGRIYGLPKMDDPYSGCNVMFIRQDWLDNLGLEIPETMDELREVAYAFTHDDPDGNGQNDTYGLALDGVNILNNSVGDTDPIFNAFGCYLGDNGMTYIEDENGEITWGGANAEGMKAALTFLQGLYQDGSIATDFITMDSTSVFEETGAGRCGIWFAPNWGAMEPIVGAAQNDVNARIVAAPVPDGLDQGGSKAYVASSPDTIYCVSSQCENPEVLIKLWNLSVKYQSPEYTTPEEYNMYYGDSANYSGWKTSLIAGGPAGTGQMTYHNLLEALEADDPSSLNTKELENYNSLKTYMDAVEGGTFDPLDTEQQRGHSLYTVYGDPQCAWVTIEEMMDNDQYVLAAYNGIPSETVTNAIPTLQKLLVENIVKIITGAETVDSYDSFLDTWYAMGGQDALNEANGN